MDRMLPGKFHKELNGDQRGTLKSDATAAARTHTSARSRQHISHTPSSYSIKVSESPWSVTYTPLAASSNSYNAQKPRPNINGKANIAFQKSARKRVWTSGFELTCLTCFQWPYTLLSSKKTPGTDFKWYIYIFKYTPEINVLREFLLELRNIRVLCFANVKGCDVDSKLKSRSHAVLKILCWCNTALYRKGLKYIIWAVGVIYLYLCNIKTNLHTSQKSIYTNAYFL